MKGESKDPTDAAKGPRQPQSGAPRARAAGKEVIWPATLASGALVAQMVAGKATRDTLFLSEFGIGLLPAAMIGAALVSFVAVVAVSRALSRYGPARVVPASFALGGALFLVEWWLSLHRESWTAIAVYLHTAVFFSASGSAFWSLVNERYDPHTAKRLVGKIASGGTIGGVIAGVLVWRAAAMITVPQMLALLAAINVLGLCGAIRTIPRARDKTGKDSVAIVAGGGLRVLGDTPYLRDLALLVVAGSVVQALLDWLLSAQASAVYAKGQELLGFFALFNMVTSALSFVAQTALTRPVLEKRGLGGTIKLQPASIAIGVVAALVAPNFAAVVVLRGIESVTRSSLYRSAYELFYTPLPASKKRPTKTLIDVGFDRVGTALGSAALLAVAHVASPNLQTRLVLFGVLVVSAAAWFVSARLQDGYVSALAASLKSGAVALDVTSTEDFTTKKTLAETTALLDRNRLLARIEQFHRGRDSKAPTRTTTGTALGLSSDRLSGRSLDGEPSELEVADPTVARSLALRSNDAPRIRRALAGPLTPEIAPHVVPLLANDLVVRDAVRALRKIAVRTTGMLVDHLLDPEIDPRVRRRLPRVLKVCRNQRAADGLVLALRDPVFDVRVQVALALGQLVDGSVERSGTSTDPLPVLVHDRIFEIVLHELGEGRRSWVAEDRRDETNEANEARDTDAKSGASEPPPAERETPYRGSTPSPEAQSKAESKPGDVLHRGLAHVFTVLGLVLEREPLAIAYRALRGEDPALRGTAFEYLEVVLPERLRNVIVPLLGDVRPTMRRRPHRELADELLRSGIGLERPRTS